MEYQRYRGSARRTIRLVMLVCTMLAFSGSSTYTDLTFVESINGISDECPQWILNNQVLIDVVYYGFDEKIHPGQLVADTPGSCRNTSPASGSGG